MVMNTRYIALYDGQCEICQAFISWLRVLDRTEQVKPIPLEAAELDALCADLSLEQCLRELHVISPDRSVYRGWDAVARLARLFPATWLVGALGSIPPFRWACSAGYRFVARNRYALSKCRGGACHVTHPESVKRRSPVAADGKVFLLSASGKVTVLKASAQWEILAVNDLGEESWATPALADGHIYIRTRSTLYSFGSKSQ